MAAYELNIKDNNLNDNKKILSLLSEEDKNKFSELSIKDQNKFIRYMNNPEFLLKALKNKNSEIKIKKNLSISRINKNSRLSIYNNKATYKETAYLMWIKFLEVKAWIRYSHNWNKIVEIQGSNALVTRNYMIWTSHEFTWGFTKIQWNKAMFITDLTFYITIKELWFIMDSMKVWVWWDTNWDEGGWIQRH